MSFNASWWPGDQQALVQALRRAGDSTQENHTNAPRYARQSYVTINVIDTFSLGVCRHLDVLAVSHEVARGCPQRGPAAYIPEISYQKPDV